MYIDTSKKSKGLGDTIEKFTSKTGIKTITEAVAKLAGLSDCGCDERKEYLNELFPYEHSSRKVICLKDTNWMNFQYKVGREYIIRKSDKIHEVIIQFVRDGYFKEI